MIRTLTVLASAVRADASACGHVRIAGVEALVARPRRGSGPVVVYANAMTPLGVEQPQVGRFLAGLAGAGFVGVAPELPNVRGGEVTPETIDALVRVARAAGPQVALVGASTGAGLAILAAGDPRLAHRVTAVAAIAPFASLRSILRLGTTGSTVMSPSRRRRSSAQLRRGPFPSRHPTIQLFPRFSRIAIRAGSTPSTRLSSPRRGRSSTSSRR